MLIANSIPVPLEWRCLARVAVIQGRAGYRVQTVIFPDESHLSVIPAAISRAFNFALSVDGDGPPARAPDPKP